MDDESPAVKYIFVKLLKSICKPTSFKMIEENKKRGDSGIILNIWLEKTSDRSSWHSIARLWKNQTIDESVS